MVRHPSATLPEQRVDGFQAAAEARAAAALAQAAAREREANAARAEAQREANARAAFEREVTEKREQIVNMQDRMNKLQERLGREPAEVGAMINSFQGGKNKSSRRLPRSSSVRNTRRD